MRSRLLLLLAALAAALVPASAAHAAALPTGTAPCYVDRADSLDWIWELDGNGGAYGDGDLAGDGDNEYDGGLDEFPTLLLGGFAWESGVDDDECGRALDGREVTTPEVELGEAGLAVQRAVYVPRTGQAFARFRTAITNRTAAPVTIPVAFDGGLDSNSGDYLRFRAAGSAPGVTAGTPSTAARWLAADLTYLEGDGTEDLFIDAGLLALVDGYGTPTDRIDTLDVPADTVEDPGAITWGYSSVTIPAGATVEFVQFAGQRDERLPYEEDADGLYRASDELWAGMSAAERARVRNWDAREPQTGIVAQPTRTNDTTPAFTFTGTPGPVAYECRVLPAQLVFSPCASGAPVGTFADGDYTLEVRARGSESLVVDETPASRAFTVDTDAPRATITVGPSGRQSSTTAAFAFVADDPAATISCRLDGAPFVNCGPSETFSGLADGPHTVDVRATDVAGNVSPVVSRSFAVDTTPPDTTITTTPAALSSDTTPTFAFASEPGATFRCRLGTTGPFETCATPLTLPALDDGAYTFQVRAQDDVGNADPTPASFAFTVDTEGPVTTIDSGPPARTANHLPTFTFSATGPPTAFDCSVDGGPFTPCTSPFAFAQGRPDGPNTFDVRARDAAGNIGAPVRSSYVVDRTAPDTSLTLTPEPVSSDTTPTFGFTSPEAGATFVCSVDAGPFEDCASPLTTIALDEGEHTFRAAARDDLGNTDATPAAFTFTVDTAPTTTTITSGPDGPIAVDTATFAFTAPDAASYECRLVGRDFAPCADAVTYDDLADGTYTFQVQALDAAGNLEDPPASRTFSVDTTGPDTTITTGPAAVTTDATPTFAVAASEPGTTFRCAIDGAAPVDCASPFTTTTLADGSHTVAVAAVDALGNADPTPATSTFRVDTTAPDTSIPTAPPASSTSVVADLAFAATEDATYECRVVPAAFAACASTLKLGPLAPGDHVVEVRARDAAGLVDASPAVARFTVEAPPVPVVATAPPAVVETNVPPVLSGLKVAARCSRSTVRRASFTLSEDADVRFVLLRRRSPTWRTCPSVTNARKEDRTPVTTVARGSLPFDGGTRSQTVAATTPRSGRARAASAPSTRRLIDASKLRPGTYVLMAIAKDAQGAESASVTAKFWVLAPKRKR